MIRNVIFAACAAMSLAAVAAPGAGGDSVLKILADSIAVDPKTESLVASGNVVAVHAPYRVLSAGVSRDAKKLYRFENPTMVTTCTNAIGSLHWHVNGSVEYLDGEYAQLEDGWVHLWEIPIFWIPYLHTSLYSQEGLRIMPGYYGRWGAFVMTKYLYHLAGSRTREDGSWFLDGSTRFDLRWEQGVAFGEELDWQLGDYGIGRFKVYYALDRSGFYDDNWNNVWNWNFRNWGSSVPQDRYAVEFRHFWEITERDTLRAQAAVFSDSYFRGDFLRESVFMLKNQFLGYDSNEIAWEHVETWSGLGVSVSGPLNEFVGGTTRLPEVYFDVMPLPVWTLPVDYESANRLGFLRRSAAQFGGAGAGITPYSRIPGEWADYETFRFDTYHRLTAPFKVADVLSVVPRLAYRGTYWGSAGNTCLTGYEESQRTSSDIGRSILEGGVTFSARGTADYDGWRHTVEPYFDALAQKAWYAGLGSGNRPYVFDALDASLDWSDQFASRGRNLPYSWYGVVPGFRNLFYVAGEKDGWRRVLDIDLYTALQCNDTEWLGTDDCHKLAAVGKPNYGGHSVTAVPGLRTVWNPVEDVSLGIRLEYDSEHNTIATGAFQFNHRLDKRFSYYLSLMQSDFRRWDFSSSPYDRSLMRDDTFNLVQYTYAQAGFEHELCDAFAWSPYIRWDCREGQLDSAGSWFDFRTDCLGFRFLLEYSNSYILIDGSRREDDFSVGFYVYLRCFGADSGNLFTNR